MLFDEDRDIELPVFNQITIPEDERPFDIGNNDDMISGKGIPFFSSISRMMYAAGDLSKPNSECISYLIGFMKLVYDYIIQIESCLGR